MGGFAGQVRDRQEERPDFAVPPSEDQLPKPAPVLLWQQGKDKWHVDAPVTVVGDRVLVASAFLDKEQLGDRALFCLDAKTGDIVWRKPLTINPWGGPSVVGKTVVVSGSTIGYDPKAIKGARGELTAFDLETGDEKWHKDIKGGVVSCAALTDDAAVVDGHRRQGARLRPGDGRAPLDLRRQGAAVRPAGDRRPAWSTPATSRAWSTPSTSPTAPRSGRWTWPPTRPSRRPA